jgi:hypothetical protein
MCFRRYAKPHHCLECLPETQMSPEPKQATGTGQANRRRTFRTSTRSEPV